MMNISMLYKYDIYLASVLSMLLIVIVLNYMNKEQEGLEDIGEIISEMKNVTSTVNKLPTDITNIKSYISDGLNEAKTVSTKLTDDLQTTNATVNKIPVEIINIKNDLTKSFNEAKSISDKLNRDLQTMNVAVNKIPIDITNIKTDIEEQANKAKDASEKLTIELQDKIVKLEEKIEKNIDNKFSSFTDNLHDSFMEGFVNPMMMLFNGIGSVFKFLFSAIKGIIFKIANLPGCLPIYLSNSILNGISNLIPNFILNALSWIFYFPLQGIYWILNITGYTKAYKECYSLELGKELDKVKKDFDDINETFKNDFGRLQF